MNLILGNTAIQSKNIEANKKNVGADKKVFFRNAIG